MNSFSQTVIFKFNSPVNKKHLKEILDKQFPNHGLNMEDSFYHFSKRIGQELYLSDPIGSADYQVSCFNLQFLQDRADYIRTQLKPITPSVTLTDGQPGARYRPNLESWKLHASPMQTMRSDTQESRYNPYNDFGCDTANIVSCDQSNINTSYHVEAFETPYMRAMNRDVRPDDAGLGNVSVEGDKRLLERKIFRNNNEIPGYEQRLQRRHIDRDIDETIAHTGEMAYIQHGYDQSSIDRRASLIENRNFKVPPQQLSLGFQSPAYW